MKPPPQFLKSSIKEKNITQHHTHPSTFPMPFFFFHPTTNKKKPIKAAFAMRLAQALGRRKGAKVSIAEQVEGPHRAIGRSTQHRIAWKTGWQVGWVSQGGGL